MIKQASLVLVLSIVGGLIAAWMYDFLIPASIPFLPLVPVAIYYAVVVLVSAIYAMGLALGATILAKDTWRLISSRERRDVLWEKVRSWPNSKWDAFGIATISYFAGIMTLSLAAVFVLPRESLVGVIAPEEGARILVFALAPLVGAWMVVLLKLWIEEYRKFKNLWITGTRKRRVGLAVSFGIGVASGIVLAVGEMAGWNQVL